MWHLSPHSPPAPVSLSSFTTGVWNSGADSGGVSKACGSQRSLGFPVCTDQFGASWPGDDSKTTFRKKVTGPGKLGPYSSWTHKILEVWVCLRTKWSKEVESLPRVQVCVEHGSFVFEIFRGKFWLFFLIFPLCLYTYVWYTCIHMHVYVCVCMRVWEYACICGRPRLILRVFPGGSSILLRQGLWKTLSSLTWLALLVYSQDFLCLPSKARITNRSPHLAMTSEDIGDMDPRFLIQVLLFLQQVL